MKKEERLEVFRINLTKLANAGEGGFVIFDACGKFVQFAGGRDLDGFVCDIPFTELSEAERTRLLKLTEFFQSEGARDEDSDEQVSYTAEFDLEAIEKAVQLTERIFVDVFLFSPDYQIRPELNLEG